MTAGPIFTLKFYTSNFFEKISGCFTSDSHWTCLTTAGRPMCPSERIPLSIYQTECSEQRL
jgi:hypothetical protein